jgi:hypothetical protein
MLDGNVSTAPHAVGPRPDQLFDEATDAARSRYGRSVTILATLEFLGRFIDDEDLARLVRAATARALVVMVAARMEWERPAR